MSGIFRFTYLVIALSLTFAPATLSQTVRIMPMGNSITFDSNYADETNPRPIGNRISYRYRLYQLLTNAGYSFDYVGSENSGVNYFQDPEMDDNAGFPGITKGELLNLVKTGYNPMEGVYEVPSPGNYMTYFPADIILLHIGTNNVDENPWAVGQILNYIRAVDADAYILVARIINRKTHSAITTTFNNNVEAMVQARGDTRIISVNMETGAGIDYDNDMADILHPNQTGFNKMAQKWFEVIDGLNSPPVASAMLPQSILEGTPFPGICLDAYISDAEDTDNKISWTFRQPSDSNLLVTIDANRTLQITPINADWNGSETFTLYGEDSGNGAFRKKDSIEVVFTVMPVNDCPTITSQAVDTAYEDVLYSYVVTAFDADNKDTLTLSVKSMPNRLVFDPITGVLSGTPTNDEVGNWNITLSVSDGEETYDQSFALTVNNTNDLPVIITSPEDTVMTNDAYFYEIRATDADEGDTLMYSSVEKPGWLTFTPYSGLGILSGVPTSGDQGSFSIVLKVNDGHSDAFQEYILRIILVNGISDIDNGVVQEVFPNPSSDKVYFKLDTPEKAWIELFDISGNLQMKVNVENRETAEIDLSELSNGVYLYKVSQNNNIRTGRIIKE